MPFNFLYDRKCPLQINSFRILNQALYFKLLECGFPEFRNATGVRCSLLFKFCLCTFH